MSDEELLLQLATLFSVNKDEGTAAWGWEVGVTVGRAGTPELEAALIAYRERKFVPDIFS